MPTAGIRVLVIGQPFPEEKPRDLPYVLQHLPTVKDVMASIATFKPDTIVTIGPRVGVLVAASYQLRKRWLHFNTAPTAKKLIEEIEANYDHNLFDRNDDDDANPMVSIYTPTYNTGSFLREAWESLHGQTYPTFEWVVVDDASTDGAWDELQRLAAADPRVRPYRAATHDGRIGALKDLATRLCRGEILVELDHDDMLTDNALADIVTAFKSDPLVGFVYSDYAGFFEDGSPHRFPATWEWPWNTPDRYREEEYHGRKYLVCNQMSIYDRFGTDNFMQQFGWYLTVGPHHVRAFRASTFRQLGGYNPGLPVADDWEVMSKFFIHSRCMHIPKLCYLYRVRDAWGNATFDRMQSIQDHLALVRRRRADDFKRIFELRRPREAPAQAAPVPIVPREEQTDEPAFVIASRSEEDAAPLRSQLAATHTVAVIAGKRSILEAYEAGRLLLAKHRRIVYLHDDVEIQDLPAFLAAIANCAPGLHGVIGSMAAGARDSEKPWWKQKPLHGCVRQKLPDGSLPVIRSKSVDAAAVDLLDGLCLITVDQHWSWRLPGDPILWHAYDWLACKRTADAGFPISTLPQSDEPLLLHRGFGRVEGLTTGLKIARALSRTAAERRDFPNIKDHLPRLKALAHGNVLELGSREGASTSALLEGVSERGGFVWSVDRDPACAEAWLGHPSWKFVCGDSTSPETIEALTKAGLPDRIDMLFVDTEPNYDQIVRELQTWLPRMAADGVVILHDTDTFPEVARALCDIAMTFGLTPEFVSGCNGLGILRMNEARGVSAGGGGQQGEPSELDEPIPDRPATLADVTCIVLDATAGENAQTCIASIREFAPHSEIILVGNGVESRPEARALATQYLHIEGNIGFAAGCNRGARSAKGSYLCFMNDDAEFVDGETPKRLLARIDARDCIAAPYTNRGKPPQGNYARADAPADDKLVPMVTGMCMMLKRTLFEKLGGFDTRFVTWEDDDLCLRAAEKFGAQRIIVGGTWVKHKESQTFRALGLDPQAVIDANRIVFNEKHPRVCVVALVKNESAAIEGFFEHFKGIERFYLLDTGSTDDTIDKAMGYAGVEVQQTPNLVSEVGFAEARNRAIEYVRGDSDWIIMLDPDERLDKNTRKHLPELLFNAKYDIYLAPLIALYPNGTRREFVPKPFLFRNKPEIAWSFKVHEKLLGSHAQALVANGQITHVRSLHDGSRREAAEKLYEDLAAQEPYHSDPIYRTRMREEWPILDYDHPSDPRIANVHLGPLVSVIIPTYKRSDMLEYALVSARAQTWTNLEIIVVGDCDPTLALQTMPPDLRIINLPQNHGAGGAVPRNVGIQAAQGEYIAYLDDDNEWTPDHITSIMNEILRTGATWGFSSMSIKGTDLGFRGPPALGHIDTSCVVHHKSLFYKHGPWKNRIEANYWHDWELFSRWVAAKEPWVATKLPTLRYNAESSGQAEFLRAPAEQREG